MTDTATPPDQTGTEKCGWCRGDGQDHATTATSHPRECTRCDGSGRVRVAFVRGQGARRRSYLGPAPKPGVVAAQQSQELTQALRKDEQPKKKPGRKAGQKAAANG